jgi:hypothetical protein
MPRYAITLEILLGDHEGAEGVAERLAEELLEEAREHLLDDEQIELVGVQPVTRPA